MSLASSKDVFDTHVTRIMVATDRSGTANHAVAWAHAMAERCDAELHLVQVIVPTNDQSSESSVVEQTRADLAARQLGEYARELMGERAKSTVVMSDDPAGAIIDVVEAEQVDVLVVGNLGMKDRKEFLLGNIPNRISHGARCTVVIVNTATGDGPMTGGLPTHRAGRRTESQVPHLAARSAHIGTVATKSMLKAVLRRDETSEGRRRQATLLREGLEELGPTFAKIGQILSTRPDLLPPEFITELATLQDHVPTLSEAEVVAVMEQELGVPWEDVFASIDPEPLAAASIGQVHRTTLTSGERAIVKLQRPTARAQIEEDLALLKIFAERASRRPKLSEVVDLKTVYEQLAISFERELDFRQEASNMERMRELLDGYDHLGVPKVYRDLSTQRLLVMEEIEGVPIAEAPAGQERKIAARQLLESYYQQIMTDGFFHADPHPGNLMWWKDSIYFLDFGMVGEVDAGLRQQIVLLMMAFWQEDAAFLTDVTLAMAGADTRRDLDASKFEHELGELMARYRSASLRDIQLGPILQEMSEISMRYKIRLPAELTLTGKALAQMQLATAQLDPDLDPFEVAGKYLMRQAVKDLGGRLDPASLLYQTRRLQVRFTRVVEAIERLIGARPGDRLSVNFAADTLEATVRRGARRIGIALAAGAALVASGLLALADRVPAWIPAGVGAVAALLTLGLVLDVVRGK
jgi:predicted unusual protein kinase regulating ubiquinone biosynthesis (AarF/ABC1/UbiB family)/nucleotide-binding universal stress UspA family protein